jgi:hypothetical protein
MFDLANELDAIASETAFATCMHRSVGCRGQRLNRVNEVFADHESTSP